MQSKQKNNLVTFVKVKKKGFREDLSKLRRGEEGVESKLILREPSCTIMKRLRRDERPTKKGRNFR